MPALLVGHIAGTAGVHNVFEINDTYVFTILNNWGSSWGNGVALVAGLIVIWTHGGLGLHFWLRLKPDYSRYRPVLYAFCIILPAAAIAGFVASAREISVLMSNDEWRNGEFEKMNLPSDISVVVDWVRGLMESTWTAELVLIGIILLVHLLRHVNNKRRKHIEISYPNGKAVSIEPGASVLDASRLGGIPHASVCGGRGRCSTCRVRVIQGLEDLADADEAERKVLDRVGAGDGVRLACQLKPNNSISVVPMLPPTAEPKDGFRRPKYLQGTEREIAILFADLRSFTKFSESKLPFDVVFALNQYFRFMGAAVEDSGGHLDKFIGDGIMALFGVESGLEKGCQEALHAASAMADALDALNDQLKDDLEEPLRMGIGIHSGAAIVGEMGYRRAVSVTAIGDVVNTASRLETATKEHGAQLIISEDLARASGYDFANIRQEMITVRGKSEPMPIHVFDDARDIPFPAS
jgi:adenylate cyclase